MLMEIKTSIIGNVDGVDLRVITVKNFDYVPVKEFLYASGLTNIDDWNDLVQHDLYFYQAFKTFEVEGKETVVIDIVNALGLIHRIPGEFSVTRMEVFTAYRMRVMTLLEFYQWKIDQLNNVFDSYRNAVNEKTIVDEHLINLQNEALNILKKL